jgi:hypothetical protein
MLRFPTDRFASGWPSPAKGVTEGDVVGKFFDEI